MKTLIELKSIIQKIKNSFQLIQVFILVCFISFGTYGQDVEKIIDRMIDTLDNQKITYFNIPPDKNQIDVLTLRNYLKALRRQEEINKKSKGDFIFGLKIQKSENKDLSEFSVGVDFKKGGFPGELIFESNIDIRFENGELVENLSNLFMAYDYHFFDTLTIEGYGFIRRTSNDYLNIQQRYEAGTGVVWNIFYSGNCYEPKKKEGVRLTEDGKNQYNRLDTAKNSITSILGSENLNACNEKICKKFNIKDNEKKAFEKSYKRSINSIIKDNSGIRLSFLAGLNYEVETTKDSLKLYPDDKDYRQSYEPKKLYRIALGPILEIKIGQLEFLSRLYFKHGIFNNNNVSKVYSDDETKEDIKNDYRIEWPTQISFNFTKKVSLIGTFYYVYMNAPNRSFINLANDPLIDPPDYELFQAANQFFMTRVGLKFKL